MNAALQKKFDNAVKAHKTKLNTAREDIEKNPDKAIRDMKSVLEASEKLLKEKSFSAHMDVIEKYVEEIKMEVAPLMEKAEVASKTNTVKTVVEKVEAAISKAEKTIEKNPERGFTELFNFEKVIADWIKKKPLLEKDDELKVALKGCYDRMKELEDICFLEASKKTAKSAQKDCERHLKTLIVDNVGASLNYLEKAITKVYEITSDPRYDGLEETIELKKYFEGISSEYVAKVQQKYSAEDLAQAELFLNMSLDYSFENKKLLKPNISQRYNQPFPVLIKQIKPTMEMGLNLVNAVYELNKAIPFLNTAIFNLYRYVGLFSGWKESLKSVENQVQKFEKKVLPLFKKVSPDHAVTKNLEQDFAQLSKAIEEATNGFLKQHTAGNEASRVSTYLKRLESLVQEAKSCATCNTLPQEIKAYFPSYINQGNNLKSIQCLDYQILLVLYEEAGEVMKYIQKNDMSDKEVLLKNIQSIQEECIWLHPRHCIRAAARSNKKEEEYLKALERFPKARKAALDLLNHIHHKKHIDGRSIYQLEKDKFDIKDPCTGTNAEPFPENEEDYQSDVIPLVPNEPNVPHRDLDQESNRKFWTDFRKSHTGKIIFSTQDIAKEANGEGLTLSNEFNYGDPIHARAYWPKAIRNLPMAKSKKTGEYLYGPNIIGDNGFYIEFLLKVKIDGKEVLNPEENICGAQGYMKESGPKEIYKYEEKIGTITDFYTYTQTCRVFVQPKQINSYGDEWVMASWRLSKILESLPPGAHKVNMDLCYRIVTKIRNLESFEPKFPAFDSPVSFPISSGEFTINVPSNPTPRNYLPKRPENLKNPKAKGLEEKFLTTLKQSASWGTREYKKEEIMYCCVQQDNFQVIERNLLTNQPITWSIDMIAVIYRREEHGWDRNRVAIFYLSYITQNDPSTTPIPDCHGIGVSTNDTFDPSLVPESVFKEYSIRWK